MKVTEGRGTTVTVKVAEPDKAGKLLSVARTVMECGPTSVSAGVQLNWPFVAPMMALVGAPGSRLNTMGSWFALVAVTTMLKVVRAWMVRLEMAAATGAMGLISFMVPRALVVPKAALTGLERASVKVLTAGALLLKFTWT